ncbi:MAG: TonB family protein [Candidatus Angelobacter sp.]
MDFLFDQDRREWTTLVHTGTARHRIRSWSLVGSAGIHLAMIAVLCWPALPIFIRPNLIAHGEGGNSSPVSIALYLPTDVQQLTQNKPLLSLPAAQKKPHPTRAKKRTNTLDLEKPTGNIEAGSSQGSGYDGPTSGDEVKPALPVAFQDLQIPRSELPSGLQGDVIVEITIDERGSVVEEKLLQGLGHGVDERVIAVLHDWRFRPATRNGIAIPSKHDVHFHFPS